ncbi:MAG: ATP-binding cassette domain-containing protein, partial [Planctomycetota bacterium]
RGLHFYPADSHFGNRPGMEAGRKMKNLTRALRQALTYRWSILGSFLCSIGVAICWGANLGGVYPFVEVVLNGKTLIEWAEQRIADSQAEVAKLDKSIADLKASQSQADPSANIDKDLSRKVSERDLQLSRIESTEKLLPWLQKYTPKDAFQTLTLIIGFLLVATFFRGLFLMGNMILVARVGQRTILDLQNQVFRNVLSMESHELGVQGTGDLVNRIRGETGLIGQAITNLFGKTLREPLKMLACLGCAAWINWRLLVISLLVVPFAVVLMLVLARSTKRANRRAMEESAKLLNRLYQALTYSRIVRAFTMESHERARFEVVSKDVYKRGMKISLYGALARINNELLGLSIIGLAVLAGGYLVIKGETSLFGVPISATPMKFGEVMTFFAFLCGVADPLRKMSDVYGTLQAGQVAADRVYPLIDQQPAIGNPDSSVAFPSGPLSLELDNVRFGYEADKEVLKGLSVKIPAGTSLAIIGPNGCGKSTLVNLVPRFFDPHQGSIRINGIDSRELGLKHLRKSIGYVTQTAMLFADTIGNNIRYGTPNASQVEVISAARKAHADGFIQELAHGYDTDVGEHGGRLSGGQRQRLTLARAILKDPAILLLDEATSQIDPQSELLIHQALKEFIKGRTTVIITHRLSTLELVDKILVMADGRAVDCGTHDELMRRCETYRALRESEMQEAA